MGQGEWEAVPKKGSKITLSGKQARQGHIVLRTPLRRAIFVGGLIGIVLLSFVLALGQI